MHEVIAEGVVLSIERVGGLVEIIGVFEYPRGHR